MSDAAAIHARFFPQARPIVKADPELWRQKPLPEPPKMIRRLIGEPVAIVPPLLRIERIVKIACTLFGCTKPELLGDGRDALLVKARVYVSVRLKRELGFSRAQIGKVINRDGSSVFNLLAKAAGVPLNAHGKRKVMA